MIVYIEYLETFSKPYILTGVIFYLYGGLSMIMLWIALILRIPQLNFKTFLITEKQESDEHSQIIDYNKEIKHNNYGTEFSTRK